MSQRSPVVFHLIYSCGVDMNALNIFLYFFTGKHRTQTKKVARGITPFQSLKYLPISCILFSIYIPLTQNNEQKALWLLSACNMFSRFEKVFLFVNLLPNLSCNRSYHIQYESRKDLFRKFTHVHLSWPQRSAPHIPCSKVCIIFKMFMSIVLQQWASWRIRCSSIQISLSWWWTIHLR